MKKLMSVVLLTLFVIAIAFADHEDKVIPAGADFVLRTSEVIDSETTSEGRTYAAVVEQNVMDSSGAALIRKGSDARLVIRRMESGGTVGSPQLVLDVDSVTVDGRRYMVSTADVAKKNKRGIGKNRRTAEMIGGGAAAGTLIGAIAGGGKGALIGAIVGAAAGGTAQVLTRGKEVKVPAETVLTFKLDQPLRLVAR